MAGAWSSEGISFTDLNSGDTNQRAYFEFLLVVTVAGMIWAIASIILVFPFKQTLPPLAVSSAPQACTGVPDPFHFPADINSNQYYIISAANISVSLHTGHCDAIGIIIGSYEAIKSFSS